MATTAPTVEPDVAEAAKRSAIVGLALAAQDIGRLAHQIDCIGCAHPSSRKVIPESDQVPAYRLEGALQDRLLLVMPTASLDCVILTLTARNRLACIFNALSDEWLKTACDSIDNALMSLAGWFLAETGRDALATLPESLRSDAEDCLDNYQAAYDAAVPPD